MDESPAETTPAPPLERVLVAGPLVATVVLVGAVVLMGIVASARGWIPTGDDAFLSLRTRHVFSTDPVLLNNASSGGPSAGSRYNHPGAFPLTLLAPITLVGGPGALALATALLNAAWIAAISLMVRRVAGPAAQLASMVVASALVWSMGPAFMVDPWNPIFGIWPVATLVVAAWGVRRGSFRMLPAAVLAASVAFQTHLSLTVLATVTAAWATIAVVVVWWRSSGVDDDVRRSALRSILAAAAVGFVANVQMLTDQFAGSGNLGKILGGTGFTEATVSARQIAGVLVSKFALPPWWLRGSWLSPVFLHDLPSVAVTLLGVVAVAIVTGLVLRWARARTPGPAGAVTSLLGVVAVAGVSASLVATRFPLRIGVPLPYFRWVWPLAAIWTAAIVVPAAASLPVLFPPGRGFGGPQGNRTRRMGMFAGVVAVVVLSAAAFVPANADVAPNPEWAQDISREFAKEAVAATAGRGPILVDPSIQEAALWVVGALIDQLDAAGIEVRVADPVLVQQTDDRAIATGDEQWRLVLRGGAEIDDAPTGSTLLARRPALDTDEAAELDRLTEELSAILDRPGAVRLTARGNGETDADELAHLTTGELSPPELLRSVPFRLALERGAIAVDDADQRDLDRASALGARDGGRSIALYLAPT